MCYLQIWLSKGILPRKRKQRLLLGFEFSYNVCFAQYFLGNSLTCPFNPQKSHGEPEWVLTWTQPHPSYQRPWTPPATVYSSPASTVLLKAARHLGLKEMGQWNEPHGPTVETIHRVLDGSLSPFSKILTPFSVFGKGKKLSLLSHKHLMEGHLRASLWWTLFRDSPTLRGFVS